MSDFLFTPAVGRSRQLASTIAGLISTNENDIDRFDGDWGALAVSRNRHNGYRPYEDELGIGVVIGGPLGCFPKIESERVTDCNQSTAYIVQQLFRDRRSHWQDKLLGAFCILYIDKKTYEVTLITDSMSFIPAYKVGDTSKHDDVQWTLSTHIDAAALSYAVLNTSSIVIDNASVCDLILHNRITFPFTFYANGRELAPATFHKFCRFGRHIEECYWQPIEQLDRYRTIDDAADDIRNGLEEVIQSCITNYSKVALLLSAGEDSRLLACMIPPDVPLHCYSVSPGENREAQIARDVAKRLGASWQFIPLQPQSYFYELARRTLFTGSGGHGRFVHFVGVFENTPIVQEQVVLGGFKADTFLKGHYLNSRKQLPRIGFQYLANSTQKIERKPSRLFSEEIDNVVYERRVAHFHRVANLRPRSADEWVKFWPMSQDHDIVHYWSNRRLFASCEVFMSRSIAAASACLPQQWVLNRKLFQKVAKPYLQRLRWVPHGDGHFPALPWYWNIAFRPLVRAREKLTARQRYRPQGTWPSLDGHLHSIEVSQQLQSWLPLSELLGIDATRAAMAFEDKSCTIEYRYAVLQVLAVLDAIMKRGYSISAECQSIQL